MLPPRSKRYAAPDAPIPRLRLISPGQLVIGMALIVLLFALIFPRRSLLEALHHQERFDDLTLAYIDNLRRVETGDDDLTVLVTRARLDEMPYAKAEAALRPIIEKGDERLRALAGRTLAAASLKEMGRLLVGYRGEPATLARLREHHARVRRFADTHSIEAEHPLWIETLLRTPGERLRADAGLKAEVHELLGDLDGNGHAPSGRLTLAVLALNAGMEGEAARLLTGIDDAALPEAAEQALGHGHYHTAGVLYLLARERATTVTEARARFQQGIGAFMAGGLHAAAMQAAERHLGDLGNDIETLRFLTRTALAAGDPQRAADYARRLIFRPSGTKAR